jgi:hypothetical protein
METLSAEKWSLCLDSKGRILDQYTIRKIAFHGGISHEVRAEVWPFLLGYYSFDSTSEERTEIDEEKRMQYESLLASWRDSDNDCVPPDNFEDYSRIIDKDSVRTDRALEFFSDENIHNVFTLRRILKTFILLRPDIGYVQGMSDVLALPLMVLNSEHRVFWCFDFIMKTTCQGTVFSDLTLSEPLENLAKLCQYIDRPLFDHLNNIYEGEHWLFSYRLLLLNYKRELTVESCSRLWECFWSCHATEHFPLLFTASVLHYFRELLLQYSNFEQLMQFSQNLQGKVPLTLILSQAIALLEHLKSDDYCPYEIKFLISNDVCAPPPLVGFVRTRQKVTSLYSKKTEVQRHQIWRSLFGDTPVQSITSPFMLSPATENTTSKTFGTPIRAHLTELSKTTSISHFSDRPIATCTRGPHAHTLQPEAPPKLGFVPRENTIHLRDDIRRIQLTNTATPPPGDMCTNTNTLPHITTEYTRTHTCSSANAASNTASNGDLDIHPSYEEVVDTTKHMQPTCRQFPNGAASQRHENVSRLGFDTNTDFVEQNCTLVEHSTRLTSSINSKDTQFDSLRSEAELTCY